jgi:DNA-binding NarL/FixJ family response regulator
MAVPKEERVETTVHVVLITPSRLYRDALSILLSRRKGFSVIRELDSIEAAMRNPLVPRPDVIIVDGAALPDDLLKIRELRGYHREARVLIIVPPNAILSATGLIEAGVSGIIDTNSSADHLMEVVTRIEAGEVSISARLLFENHDGAATALNGSLLTKREREIIAHVADGESNLQVALALGVTENTVKGHLVNVFEKLGLSNRVQLATYAMDTGLRNTKEHPGHPTIEAA